MTSMVDEAIAWRRLRPLFEEEALGDHSAEAIAFDLLSGEQLVIRQEPRRAARLERAPAQHLGCATEAASATGATVWDSAHVVCRYLEARPSAVRASVFSGEDADATRKEIANHLANVCQTFDKSPGSP